MRTPDPRERIAPSPQWTNRDLSWPSAPIPKSVLPKPLRKLSPLSMKPSNPRLPRTSSRKRSRRRNLLSPSADASTRSSAPTSLRSSRISPGPPWDPSHPSASRPPTTGSEARRRSSCATAHPSPCSPPPATCTMPWSYPATVPLKRGRLPPSRPNRTAKPASWTPCRSRFPRRRAYLFPLRSS